MPSPAGMATALPGTRPKPCPRVLQWWLLTVLRHKKPKRARPASMRAGRPDGRAETTLRSGSSRQSWPLPTVTTHEIHAPVSSGRFEAKRP